MSSPPSPTTRQREITMRFLAEPGDVNFGGKVHGGAVMKWIDQAGYACAVGWSGQYCVTVYVGGIRFYKPVRIGHVVEVRARLIYTGNTSMHIAVDVHSGDPRHGRTAQTTHCVIIFVAVDDEGTPVPVPRWEPDTDEDRAQEGYARRLMELRKGIEDEMQAHAPVPAPKAP
jgi:acyl-CoA hydrolase